MSFQTRPDLVGMLLQSRVVGVLTVDHSLQLTPLLLQGLQQTCKVEHQSH